MRTDKTCVEIDHIISYLSRNNTVKKLTLNIGEYRLPLSLFLFDHLTDLYLISCDLDHQPPFNGFYSLTNLFIEFVTTTKSTLLHLLSNCPLLKSLTVNTDDIQGVDDFTVTNLFECFPMVENLSTWLLTIKEVDEDEELHISGILLSSQRASPLVEIVVGKAI
ncbi:hypothetical protein L1987_00468 [Smallanthus sonchifolius]|uniref:Uncharacterized protein n=1 Tax=Smallanthus sonchifolius TaxID=185202 RepID=A0ACB9K2J7_9ASTR|nr:hypothetical protein L1987_00468 [Smallanthus sonchifolius]